MTFQELRYIVALAKKKHFGLAALACFVSQPTLSIAIKKLEQGAPRKRHYASS
jgi:LysR family hydrogen peroxide-inducible transcriptional activator